MTLGLEDFDKKEMDLRSAEEAAPPPEWEPVPPQACYEDVEEFDCNCIFSFLVVCF